MTVSCKTAIITGGAQGIGRGISAHLLRQGWCVVIADKDVEAGEECLATYQGDLHFIPTDVADESAVQHCVDEALRYHGQINALVNNAGLANPENALLEALSLSDWQRVIDTNLTGYFLTAKHTVRHLRAVQGAIVNIASTRAVQSEPNCEAYAASKGGIIAFTHALAISLGPTVRVNCISPGWIAVADWQKASHREQATLTSQDHNQHPAGRVGKPEDVAALVSFLVSHEAEFITGQNFVVDGGMTRKMIYTEG
jgi:NAD(P)-dependent dehydrogenase (short-subunit alcohol dehydrogenase family)